MNGLTVILLISVSHLVEFGSERVNKRIKSRLIYVAHLVELSVNRLTNEKQSSPISLAHLVEF